MTNAKCEICLENKSNFVPLNNEFLGKSITYMIENLINGKITNIPQNDAQICQQCAIQLFQADSMANTCKNVFRSKNINDEGAPKETTNAVDVVAAPPTKQRILMRRKTVDCNYLAPIETVESPKHVQQIEYASDEEIFDDAASIISKSSEYNRSCLRLRWSDDTLSTASSNYFINNKNRAVNINKRNSCNITNMDVEAAPVTDITATNTEESTSKTQTTKEFQCSECDFQTNIVQLIKEHSRVHCKNNDNDITQAKATNAVEETPTINHENVKIATENIPAANQSFTQQPKSNEPVEINTTSKLKRRRHTIGAENNIDNLYNHTKYVFICEYCYKNLNGVESYRHHLKSEHKIDTPRMFKCNFCKKSYSSKQMLQRHQLKKHDMPKLTNRWHCYICDFCCNDLNLLKQHLLRVHKLQADSNSNANATNSDNDTVEDANEAAKENSIRTDTTTSQPTNRRRHTIAESETETETENKTTYSCEYCAKEFNAARHYKSHLINMHSVSNGIYKCSICLKLYSYKATFQRHLLNEHDIKNEDDVETVDLNEIEKIKCTHCNISVNTDKELKAHQTKAHNNKLKTNFYACNKCELLFLEYKNLKNHQQQEHNMESIKQNIDNPNKNITKELTINLRNQKLCSTFSASTSFEQTKLNAQTTANKKDNKNGLNGNYKSPKPKIYKGLRNQKSI